MHAINSFSIYYMNGKTMNELERATCSYTFILALYLDHSWLSFKTDNECTNGFIFNFYFKQIYHTPSRCNNCCFVMIIGKTG